MNAIDPKCVAKLNRCPYYIEDFGGVCMAQKNSPKVDCKGYPMICELHGPDSPYESIKEIFDSIPEPPKVKKDMVNHPSHYNNGGIECIDGLAAAVTGLTGMEAFCTANAIKYLWRWKWKNGKEDLDKAIFYINWLKEHLDDIN